jgi:hypothetical protein
MTPLPTYRPSFPGTNRGLFLPMIMPGIVRSRVTSAPDTGLPFCVTVTVNRSSAIAFTGRGAIAKVTSVPDPAMRTQGPRWISQSARSYQQNMLRPLSRVSVLREIVISRGNFLWSFLCVDPFPKLHMFFSLPDIKAEVPVSEQGKLYGCGKSSVTELSDLVGSVIVPRGWPANGQ